MFLYTHGLVLIAALHSFSSKMSSTANRPPNDGAFRRFLRWLAVLTCAVSQARPDPLDCHPAAAPEGLCPLRAGPFG